MVFMLDKVRYILIHNLFILTVALFPKEFFIFFSRILCFLFLSKEIKNLTFNNHNSTSKKNLIFLDFRGAIGDVIVLLRTILKLVEEGYIFDVILPIKMKGLFEKFNLKNINLIYKNNSLGDHFLRSKFDYNKIINVYKESKDLNYSYDKVYYFCECVSNDFLLYLMNIKYNELIIMKDFSRKWKASQVYRLFDPSMHSMSLSFFFIANYKKMKIKFVGNKKFRNSYLADYAYFIYTNKYLEKSLSNIKLSNKPNENKKYLNTLCVATSDRKSTKVPKIETIVKIINENFLNYKLLLIGEDNNKEIEYIRQNTNNELIIKNKLSLLDLMDEISKCSQVLTHDTFILHLSTLLGVNTNLIVNSSHIWGKYDNVWQGYHDINKIILDKSFFRNEQKRKIQWKIF